MKVEWKTCFRVGLTFFLLFLAVNYWDLLSGMGVLFYQSAGALLTGCIIAYLINILMSCYERFYFQKSSRPVVVKSRRIVCMLAAMVTLVGIVILIIGLVIPELVACIKLLAAEVPIAIENMIDWIQENEWLASIMTEDFSSYLSNININWKETLEKIARFLVEGVGGATQIAVTAVSSAASVVVNFVIGLIFAIYLLLGKETLSGQISRLMRRYLKPSWDGKIRYVMSTIDSCFHKFIVGQCTEAVILGLLCIIGMTIFRFPYAVMIGTLIGFTALIPIAGAYIGAAVGAFMILTVNPVQAIWFLIFILILQQLEGNIIYPKVVGSSIGLPGMWVLAAVTVGGGLYGIPGMLVGVPLTAAVYQMLRNDLHKYDAAEESSILPVKEGKDSESS